MPIQNIFTKLPTKLRNLLLTTAIVFYWFFYEHLMNLVFRPGSECRICSPMARAIGGVATSLTIVVVEIVAYLLPAALLISGIVWTQSAKRITLGAYAAFPIFLGATGLGYPMHFAVEHNLPAMVRPLAWLGLQNEEAPLFKGGCTTPLSVAATKGYTRVVDILLDNGADIYFKDCHDIIHGRNVVEASRDHPGLKEHLIKDKGIPADLGLRQASAPEKSQTLKK